MENKNMTEQESLRVITDMINRARKENIGRFNFLTVYGVLAFVMSLVAKFVEPGPWMWAWMAVPVVSLAVPFVLYRMWTWRGSAAYSATAFCSSPSWDLWQPIIRSRGI